MRLVCGLLGACALLLALGEPRAVGGDPKTRNPFGVPDVRDPEQELLAKAKLLGGAQDANAEQWVKQATAGKKDSLDGAWLDRWHGGGGGWNVGTAPAQLKQVGDRVYILVNASNGKALIETRREKDRLVGRYQYIDNPGDTGPCIFLIVNEERIDGFWGGSGRWDFRRKLQ